jgi:hypothetical protein
MINLIPLLKNLTSGQNRLTELSVTELHDGVEGQQGQDAYMHHHIRPGHQDLCDINPVGS